MKEIEEKKICLSVEEITDAVTAFIFKRKPDLRSEIKGEPLIRFYDGNGVFVRPTVEMVVEEKEKEVVKR